MVDINIKGALIMTTLVNGERHSVTGLISLYEMDTYSETMVWLFMEMDSELYDVLGFIPRDRTWEVIT